MHASKGLEIVPRAPGVAISLLGQLVNYCMGAILNSLPQATDLDEVFHVSREVGLVHGFQYLGMGALIILCIAVMAIMSNSVTRAVFSRNLKRHYFLFATLIFLTIFEVSNNISIGSYNLLIDLPDDVIYSAGILRSSGRMFWPVFYIIFVLILYICARALSKNALRLLLGICLIVQILDTRYKCWLDSNKSKACKRFKDSRDICLCQSDMG